jgi:hypothetical protein
MLLISIEIRTEKVTKNHEIWERGHTDLAKKKKVQSAQSLYAYIHAKYN